ncbi:hypothetical protein [Paenibacillus sp. M2]|uniref:hypothetical protein n=1 Tax=Paenibacillus sp. M2 TaxID=3341793 RepID=UPI0039898FDC
MESVRWLFEPDVHTITERAEKQKSEAPVFQEMIKVLVCSEFKGAMVLKRLHGIRDEVV